MRNKIIKAFLTIISALLISEIFFVATYLTITDRYRHITDTLVSEYQLSEKASNLVNSFYDLIQYSNDKKRTQAFKDSLNDLQSLLAKLDKNLANSESWAVYVGTKNTINVVIDQVNKGIDDISAGNFSEVTNDYLKAANNNAFIRENTSNLVLKELENAEKTLTELENARFWSELIGFIIFFASIIGSIVHSLFFSKRLTKTIARVAEYSRKISSGNIPEKIDEDLLAGKDEVAVIAKSLNSLSQSMQTNAKKMKDKEDELTKAQKNMVELGLQIDNLMENSESPKTKPDSAAK
jgi:methyl-accepting chemotaxis protein